MIEEVVWLESAEDDMDQIYRKSIDSTADCKRANALVLEIDEVLEQLRHA